MYELINQKFGKWTVTSKSKHKNKFFCTCECGTERLVRASDLIRKKSQSCGCSKKNINYRNNMRLHTETLRIAGKINTGFDRSDEYSAFRPILNRCKRRDKLCTITLEDVKKQWELQKGICIYSGVKLYLPTNKNSGRISHNYLASLDRIDSDYGYIPDNIQFISATCNYAKGVMTHGEMCEFIEIICKNN